MRRRFRPFGLETKGSRSLYRMHRCVQKRCWGLLLCREGILVYLVLRSSFFTPAMVPYLHAMLSWDFFVSWVLEGRRRTSSLDIDRESSCVCRLQRGQRAIEMRQYHERTHRKDVVPHKYGCTVEVAPACKKKRLRNEERRNVEAYLYISSTAVPTRVLELTFWAVEVTSIGSFYAR